MNNGFVRSPNKHCKKQTKQLPTHKDVQKGLSWNRWCLLHTCLREFLDTKTQIYAESESYNAAANSKYFSPQLECGTCTAKIHSVRMPHRPFFDFCVFGGSFAQIPHLECLQMLYNLHQLVGNRKKKRFSMCREYGFTLWRWNMFQVGKPGFGS